VVTDATPAAAHNVGGGALPAPPWLLSYVGVFVVAATAVALRASWSGRRLRGFVGPEAMVHGAPPSARPVPSPVRAPIGLHVGHLLGLLALVLVGAAAVVGPDSGAANIAPVAVLVVWWVGLPIAAWLGGDVMRAINPFVAIVALLDRGGERSVDRAPAWTSAAFLAAFAWFFVAYHRPGSPRALAVFLAVYLAAAVAGGLRWGRAWLATGEGFGGLSASVALLSPRRRNTSVPPGVGALMIVWLGSTLFDAFSSTPFWVDVLGTSQGWTRTLLNSVGLVWLTAIVAGVYLLALRLAERDRRADSDGPSLAVPLGVALIPLALGVFLAHDVTLLLFEGQNFIALLSDPLGRGWDLFGTINRTIDYRLVQAGWVPWLQLGVLVAAHVAAVVIAHDTALALVPRRTAMRFTWALAGVAAVSIVAGALMVLG
jgi:hypothetical protein